MMPVVFGSIASAPVSAVSVDQEWAEDGDEGGAIVDSPEVPPKDDSERCSERDTDPDPDRVLSDGEHDRPDDYPDHGAEAGGLTEITGFVAVFRCFQVVVCHFFFCFFGGSR
jgi:hypothetical protein